MSLSIVGHDIPRQIIQVHTRCTLASHTGTLCTGHGLDGRHARMLFPIVSRDSSYTKSRWIGLVGNALVPTHFGGSYRTRHVTALREFLRRRTGPMVGFVPNEHRIFQDHFQSNRLTFLNKIALCVSFVFDICCGRRISRFDCHC